MVTASVKNVVNEDNYFAINILVQLSAIHDRFAPTVERSSSIKGNIDNSVNGR